MENYIENPEALEQAERKITAELSDPMKALYLESIQEAERAGNEDMAEYYREKLEALEQQAAAADHTRLGGGYAGYTPAEWRRMAEKEYAANGNSMKYRDYIQNAIKAEG
ncbi:MAG: hypothetical protein IJ422_03700 [Oscillospiraceae bacterium]|nr:hypothetical protein [Oscillospiraceae bacterium]